MSEPSIQHKPTPQAPAGFAFEGDGERVLVTLPPESVEPETKAEKHEAELRELALEVRLQTLRGLFDLLKRGRADGLQTRVAALEVICTGKAAEEVAKEIGVDRSVISRAVATLKYELELHRQKASKPCKDKCIS